MQKAASWASLFIALTFSLSVQACADSQKTNLARPIVVASSSCVDTTVRAVGPRLLPAGVMHYTTQDMINTGVVVTFNTHLGMPSGWAGVTHYQDTPGNNVMMRENIGDRVQVCYLGGPTRDQYCNPDTDPRGRKYHVYDYRQRGSYAGINSEHDCGGA